MFWLMLVTGFVLSSIFEMPLISLVNLFVTPYIISKKQKVSLNKDAIFVNSEGKLLNDRYPIYAVWMLILSVIWAIALGAISDGFGITKNVDIKILTPIFFSISLLPFVLYFMYINCPISILFKPTAWHPAVLGIECSSGSNNHANSSFREFSLSQFTRQNTITDPSYRSYGCNIFNDLNRK